MSITELARIGGLFQSDPDWLHRLAVATIWIGVADVCFASYLSAIIVPTVPLRIGLTTAMEICGLVSIPAGAVAAGRPASCYSRLGAAAHRLPQEGGH